MLTIATYNIQYGVGLDERFDLDRIVSVIQDIDIVGLQEVDVSWDRSGNRDLITLLAEKMPHYYIAWQPNIDVIKMHGSQFAGPRAPRRQFGNMILSRFPILAVRNHLLPRYGAATQLDMQRGALEANIATPGDPLRVYCTHLCHLSEDQRCAQLTQLLDIIERAPLEGPSLSGAHDRDLSWSREPTLPPVPAAAIVLGDFNCTPDGAAYALLAGESSSRRGRMTRLGGFVDAWEVATQRHGGGNMHDGATRFPEPGKGKRVDFCFVPMGFSNRVASARVLTDAVGSDHLPVIIEIDLN